MVHLVVNPQNWRREPCESVTSREDVVVCNPETKSLSNREHSTKRTLNVEKTNNMWTPILGVCGSTQNSVAAMVS